MVGVGDLTLNELVARRQAELREQLIQVAAHQLWQQRKLLIRQDQLIGWRERVTREGIPKVQIKITFDDDDDMDGLEVKCPHCGRSESMTHGLETLGLFRWVEERTHGVGFDDEWEEENDGDTPTLYIDDESDITSSKLECTHCYNEVSWPQSVEHS